MDDIEAAIAILKARLRSQKSSLSNNVNSVNAQGKTIDVQIAQLEDLIEKCKIKSPIDGTVLVKYAEPGEMAAMGKALFKVADIENMILRAYVTAEQLKQLKIGQNVKVLAEFGENENREYEGSVTWISSKSEFTPKTIQTQDERANLVYAVKIAVKNDDFLKIGMYGGFKLAE
jgi:HlyD family secretion protein